MSWVGLRLRARKVARQVPLLALLAAGMLSGLTAVAFHAALNGAQRMLIGRVSYWAWAPGRTVATLLMPAAFGALLGYLVPRLAPDAGRGLALVRAAYAGKPERLSLRTWIGTFLATPLSLGSGAPLGPEGPTVVLTSAVSVGLARSLGLSNRFVRGMIPVGTAAGIAAIFNTPITGVVFALEEVIGTASRGVLGGAIVAAVAAAVVQKQAMGGEHLLPASPASWNGVHELVGFAVLGLLSGALAGWLPRLVRLARSRLDLVAGARGPYGPAVRAAVAGLGVGGLGVAVPEIMGVGYPVISYWLTGGGTSDTAALAFAGKLLAVVLALAAPLVGGVFAPSLFMGASLGAAAGHLLRLFDPTQSIDPGAYALVGMGAFFGGFLRTPIASVLIVFELTGDYGLVAPLMLAVALSTLVARRIAPVTLADHQLEQEGVVMQGREDPLARHRVREVMSSPVALESGLSMAEAREKVAGRRHREYPVVTTDGHCVGIVRGADLFGPADDAGPLATHVRAAPFVALADEPLDRLSLRMGAAHVTRCPVVESGTARLVGFIAPSDFLRARVRAAADLAGEMEPLG